MISLIVEVYSRDNLDTNTLIFRDAGAELGVAELN
jgi:hypothetical protein